MKKTLLIAGFMLASMFTANAQEVFADNFDDGDITPWTVTDADGDGRNWSVVQIQDEDGNPVGTPVLRSASWQAVALTPNNYVFSPAIDLSGFFPGSATVQLSWQVMAIDASWDLERYTCYIGTAPDVATMLASTTTHYEASLAGVNTLTTRTLDVSAFLGGPMYICFRHWGVSDQFTMEIDNVAVNVTPLSTDKFFTSNYQVFPNPADNVLNVSSRTNMTLNNVELTDINGRIVKNMSVNGVSNTQLNIADLNAGMYFLKVTSSEGTGTAKIIKK